MAAICAHCGAIIGVPSDRETLRLVDDVETASVAHAPPASVGSPAPARAAPAPGALLSPGARIGADRRYQIVEPIGRGGFGETYLAHDTQLFDAPCVVKRLLLSDHDPQRAVRIESLAREAQLLVDLKTPGHPHIPEVYAYIGAEHCLVMKYIAGESLRALIRTGRSLGPDDVLDYMRSTCSALVYMHSRGVMHLDIKPENLLLDPTGRLWVIDFGIGRSTALADQAAGIGTPGYTPPEQWRGRPEPRSDIYALAATMWALLTRRAAIERGADASGQLSAAIPLALRRLIDAGMADTPADRPSAQELLAEIEALISPEPLDAPPQSWPPPLPHDPVGRGAEIASLEARLRRDHVALLSGLVGVGKTTLAAMLARRYPELGKVFWHRFRPGEGGDVVIWQLAGFLASQGFGELWRLIQRARRSAQPPPTELLCDYAVQALRNRSFLICLDDVEQVEDQPLAERLIVGLRDSWRAGGGLLVIARQIPPFLRDSDAPALHGLSADDARALLATQQVHLTPELGDQLYVRTEGNAQLLTLAANALRRSGDPASLITRLTGSDNIERFLLEQVDDRLSEDERGLLQAAAALLGYSSSRAALAAALGRSLNRRALQSLLRRHLLTASDGRSEQEYTLHAMLREFYYTDMGAPERRAMHLRLAAHYAEEAPDRLLAARHYARAGEAEQAAALASSDVWSIMNAGQARPLAILLDELAATTLGEQRRVALDLARGEVLTLLREGARARTAYEQAYRCLEEQVPGDARAALRAQACRGVAAVLEYEAPDEALGWLQRGLGELPATSPDEEAAISIERARLRHRLGAVLLALGDAAEAEESLGAALASLPVDLAGLRADLLVNLGVARCEQGDMRGGEARFQAALESYRAQGNRSGMAAALQNLAMVADYGGDWPAATRAYSEAFELAERIGDVSRQASLRLSIGNLAIAQGDFSRSRAELDAALSLARRHDLREYVVAAGASLAELYLRTGEADLAAEALANAEEVAAGFDSADQAAELLARRAALLLTQGDPAAAREQADRALDAAADDARIAGIALRLRGQAALALGDALPALDDLAASVTALDDVDPYEAARTQYVWGKALVVRGDTDEGAALLSTAGETFTRLGAAYDIGQLQR